MAFGIPTKQKTKQPVLGGNSPAAGTDIFKKSGNDPRGRAQNTILDERSRFQQQSDPFVRDLGDNWGRSVGQANQDYGDIMSRFRDAASGSSLSPSHVSHTDPFKSYAGYEDFSKTGGYSGSDIANLRARGVAPVRAAYANAEREVGRSRALQGGYSPNAAAAQVKMAREQGQSSADALQNTNAGIAEMVQKGKLAGLGGMSDIEKQRLLADLEEGEFNAKANMSTDQFNVGTKLDALRGMTSLYGTTPGMANMFGNQLGRAIEVSGKQGTDYMNAERQAQELPGSYESKMGKIGDIWNMASTVGAPIYDWFKNRNAGGTSAPLLDPNENNGMGGTVANPMAAPVPKFKKTTVPKMPGTTDKKKNTSRTVR